MAMKPCKECGQEISSDAKICPSCGKDQRNFFIRHKFLTLIGVIVGGDGEQPATSSKQSTSNETTQQEQPKPDPMVISVAKLVEDLENNALNASNTYTDQYVEVTGTLSNIDSGGDYFSLEPSRDSFTFTNVQCFINEEHLDTVANFAANQQVTVVGTITSVGEIMGYSIDVETIK